MAGLADLFAPEDYDPKAPPLPNRAVPVRPFGELKPLGAGLITEEMARQMQEQGIGGT